MVSPVQALSHLDAPDVKAPVKNGLKVDQETFLKLLVTEMTYANPMDEKDPAQSITQLAQFSQLESQLEMTKEQKTTNNILRQQILANDNAIGLSYLGKKVEISGDQVPLENGKAEFSYSPQAGIKAVQIIISNEAGEVVRSVGGNCMPGTHTIKWDGTTEDGELQKDGLYNLKIVGIDENEKPIQFQPKISGKVTGLEKTKDTINLKMGDITFTHQNVLSVNAL